MEPGATGGVARFAAELARRDGAARVLQLPGSTRTAVEAAAAIGCEVGQIAKSIVFRDVDGDRPLLVVASGPDRISTDKLEALANARVGRADAGFVRARTGYAIGGVPPFGHTEPVATWIDEGLFALARVWAAAGGPFHVFETTAEALLQYSGATRADVTS